MDILKQNYNIFIDSIKRINLKIFLILGLEFLFYFTFMLAGNFLIKIVEEKTANVDLTQNLMGLNQQAANTLLTSVQGMFSFLVISLILFAITIIISWTLFKGLIWTITTNKKFSMKFFMQFLKLNLIWLPAWFLLMFLFAIIIKPTMAPIYMLITLATAFYFTNILYPLFLKKNKIKIIKESFRLGIKKIHHFIMPYAIIVVLFFIISKSYNLITLNINANPNIFLGIIVIFIAWLRYYFVEIVGSLSK
tara:strand:+ start:486 stop:1235 length:750 start_codon:yes stop_codon:yes gene_type:complete